MLGLEELVGGRSGKLGWRRGPISGKGGREFVRRRRFRLVDCRRNGRLESLRSRSMGFILSNEAETLRREKKDGNSRRALIVF